MADDINKKITIDIEVGIDGQQQINQYKAAFESLRNSINGLSNPLNGLSNNISSLDKDLTKLTGSIDKLNAQNKTLASSGNKVKESVKGLSETHEALDKVMRLLKKSVASLEGALTGGLSIIIAYGPELLEMVSSLVKGKEAIDKTKLSADTLNSALEGADYSNAIEQMNELKINVGLAKDGLLHKKEVLKEYNDTLGQTMGKATTLNQVETNLVNNGDAYIKMTLLKASAQLALQDAAKKAYEAEQTKNKSDDDSLTFWDKTLGIIKGSVAYAVGSVSMMAQTEKDMEVKGKQRRKDAVDDANKQKDALISIAAKFEADAAAIAKKSKFNFFTGQTDSGTIEKAKQERADALKETEQLFEASRKSQLQATYEAYGSETLAETSHYQDQLNRLKKQLDDKKITQDEYTWVTTQLETEHHEKIAGIITKYNEQDRARTEQAQNELVELQIKGMKDGAAKQIAELEQQQKEKDLQADKAEQESVDRIKKLYQEIEQAKATNNDTTGLQQQLDSEFALQQINCKKRETLEQQTANAIKKIKDQEVQDALMQQDKENADSAAKPEEKLAAEKKAITDKYAFEIQQANGNATEIENIQKNLKKDLDKLDADDEKKKKAAKDAQRKKDKQEIEKDSKEIAATAISFALNSIKQASDAKIASLEKDKASELSNTSLTSAQKLAINQKYKKEEDKIKAKAFKEQQEISIMQALINGAIAITKAPADLGPVAGAIAIAAIIASTAAQVATIAKQKPPMAKGGYFKSDGKGAVLSGYSRTDDTNAYLRSGEAVVVSEAMQVPWARNLVSAINVGFGGRDFSMPGTSRGYAVGGIFTDGGDANRYYNQPVNDQKNLANTIAYQMINNFPPVYVDVKDVNNQQNILAQTINRVNL